jgi:glucuronate isomerase
MSFINKDFLLASPTARRLYHEFAANQPIIDYHCHLPPREVAGDKRWEDLAEIWIGGDHYKWRAMRAAGVPERCCTGDASPKEKFMAWARTIPKAVRNPHYHWTHLELKRHFDCDLVFSEKTAEAIWEIGKAKLAEPAFSAQGILKKFGVAVLGTTDDPTDSLEHHRAFAASGHPTKMFPTFRPDKAMKTDDPAAWNAWTDRLGAAANREIGSFGSFVEALADRHAFFHEAGCRLSDHGIDFCPFAPATEQELARIFDAVRSGRPVGAEDAERWATAILERVGRWNAAKGWTMQIHLGALRNANSRMFARLGPDAGFDSLHDEPVIRKLARFMDRLEAGSELPRMIFYHVNPAFFYPLATLMASFQDGSVPGKMQLGSAWWHLDTLDGMRAQIDVLSSVGLLGQFVGMLTDSRSFLSFPRHEYFRRLLCEIVGGEVDSGLIPDDAGLLGDLIRGICHENAKAFFRFPA